MRESLEKKIAWMYLDNEFDKALILCDKLPKNNIVRKIIEKRYREMENAEMYPGSLHWSGPTDIKRFPKFFLARDIIRNLDIDNPKILDIGCLDGSFLRFITNEIPDITCAGVDIIDQGNNRGINCEFFNMRAQDIGNRWYKEFDIVTCFDVLEHTLNDELTIEAIEAVAKLGATIIMNLPKIVKEKRTNDYLNLMLKRKPEHMRIYTKKWILNKFGKRNDFKMFPCLDERGDDTHFFIYKT